MADPFKKHRKERDEQASRGFYWCSRCKQYKPAEEMIRSKRRYYGFSTNCKKCVKEITSTPEKLEEKKLYNRQYHIIHAEEISVSGKKWRSEHAEYLRQYEANRPNKEERRRKDNEHKRSIPLEIRRRKWKAHYEKYKSRQVVVNKARYHTEEGKRKHRVWQLRYKHRKRGTISDFTSNQWKEALAYWDFKCAYCQKNPATDQDHFVSVNSGGGYTATNIVPACDHCNSSKRNLDVEDWAVYEGIPLQHIETIREWLKGRQ